MRTFKDFFACNCGKTFAWKYVKLNNGECWFGKIEEKILNCVTSTETPNIYSFELKCPNCGKRHFVTIQK